MGFIFNRTPKDEPECLAVQVIDGAITKCCDASRRKGPLPELVADASADKIKRVVTLVHGTFARHAPWMQDTPKKVEEGALCSALRGIEGTAIRRFCWSGGNSHSARLQAGHDLAIYMQDVKKQFPDDARHFIIAHSHGGNVALYAMEHEGPTGKKLGEDVTGVITLATPFLTLTKRPLPRFVLPSVWTIVLFVLFVSVFAVISPPAPPPKPSQAFLRYPLAGIVNGDVEWIFDLNTKVPANLEFEWTTDPFFTSTGTNKQHWTSATAAISSPVTNPARSVTPGQNLTFLWDSKKDLGDEAKEVGVNLRIRVNGAEDSVITTMVDNSSKARSDIRHTALPREPFVYHAPGWNTIIVVSALFTIWLSATFISARQFYGRQFKLTSLLRFFRELHNPDQQHLDHELLPLQPGSMNADKLFIMRPLGDEASMGLVVSQFLSWGQNKILIFLQSFQNGFLGRMEARNRSIGSELRPIAKLRSLLAGCFFTILNLIVLIALLFWGFGGNTIEADVFGRIFTGTVTTVTEHEWGQIVVSVPLLLFIALLVFFVVFGFVSLIALIGLQLAALPFGPDAMFWNHFTSTTAEPSPVGQSPAQIFHAAPQGGSVAAGLAHSGIYTNPVAIEQIVDWIKRRSK